MSKDEALLKRSLGVRCWDAKERLDSIPGRYFDGKGKLARFQRSLFRVRSRGLSSCCSLRDALKGWPWRECCVWMAHGDFWAAAAAASGGCDG